jgi:hypothetical protein
MFSTRTPFWVVSRPEEKDLPSPRQTMVRSAGAVVQFGQNLPQVSVELAVLSEVRPRRRLVGPAVGGWG